MRDIRFSNDHRGSQAGGVLDVLKRPRLWVPSSTDYPDYDDWLEKTETQIVAGEKRAMLATIGGRAAGAIVYRRHEVDSQALEIRNISVMPETQGRLFGSFLLRQVEVEGAQDYPGVNHVVVDTKLTNNEMIGFLENNDYVLDGIEDLYGLGAGEDAVFSKPL